MTRLSRRITAWLALFALLFGIAAPGLAVAWAPLSGQSYTEICTPTGIQRIATDDGAPAPLFTGQQHCPLCLAGGVAGALPSVELTYGVPETDPAAFLDFAQVPRPTPSRDRGAEPRGPPAFS